MRRLPEVPGIISARQVADTVDAIASVQQPDGNIPWTPGGHTDAWNLVASFLVIGAGTLIALVPIVWLTRRAGAFARHGEE